MTEVEAEARVLAAGEMVMLNIPRLENIPGSWGSLLETLTKRRTQELVDQEPKHLRDDQLLELYCLELIEAVKSHRVIAGTLAQWCKERSGER